MDTSEEDRDPTIFSCYDAEFYEELHRELRLLWNELLTDRVFGNGFLQNENGPDPVTTTDTSFAIDFRNVEMFSARDGDLYLRHPHYPHPVQQPSEPEPEPQPRYNLRPR
jgi:hypothetical protein